VVLQTMSLQVHLTQILHLKLLGDFRRRGVTASGACKAGQNNYSTAQFARDAHGCILQMLSRMESQTGIAIPGGFISRLPKENNRDDQPELVSFSFLQMSYEIYIERR
jgi:hypothetical protein